MLDLKSKLPYISADMVSIRLPDYHNKDLLKNPMDYFTAKFCAYLSRSYNLKQFQCSEIEKQELEKALAGLKNFQELDSFLDYCSAVEVSTHNLRQIMVIQQTSSNLITYDLNTNQELVQKMKELFMVYKDLLDSCKEYPHWQEKIREEIGFHWAIIYSMH